MKCKACSKTLNENNVKYNGFDSTLSLGFLVVFYSHTDKECGSTFIVKLDAKIHDEFSAVETFKKEIGVAS